MSDNVPQLDCLPTVHREIELGLLRDQVTKFLTQDAYSFDVKNVPGVDRYDGAQIASNDPCEDRLTHGKFSSPWDENNSWMAWGVFDGHSGSQTAELLEKQLLPFVRQSLSRIGLPSDGRPLPIGPVQRAIMKGFTELDNSIIESAANTADSDASLSLKIKKLLPAYSGSCALLSIFDPITSTLHVACTGNSRAVLGQKSSGGNWKTIPLSEDQTGYNQDEIAQPKSGHPGERNIVQNGRVLEMAVSRAFGDCQWKWPIDFQRDMERRFHGPPPLTPRFEIRTPPYLTAEPVVTSTKIDANRSSFLIMATDGLWDLLSSHQGVELVGKWLETPPEARKCSLQTETAYEPFDFEQSTGLRFKKRRTTTQDDNAAVHLLRNALGGNHHDLIAGRLAFTFPFSRRVRDDTTVQVVFFNGTDQQEQ
ncbi:phosphatase 2C-like domain-containing protein [Aspergillus karnatakaensis]|uniref:PP2C family serine/threonine-protein phosphatase n=1 Tax=Aspergillus karnatakaensis TaxID=1810916 RepID=UPI003CCCD834